VIAAGPAGEAAIRASRFFYARHLATCVVFVAVGLLLARKGERPVGWLGVALGAVGVPIFLRQIFDRRPRLVIDERGIFDRSLRVGVIPWSEITGTAVRSVSGNTFIALELRDPALFTRQFGGFGRALTSANRKLGFRELNLNLTGLAVRADEVLALIRQHRERR
jgi:hypothetical protein